MSLKDKHPELWSGLENKFWLWLSKQGAFSNLQTELKQLGLKYDDFLEEMVKSYLNDHYKSAYYKPFTATLFLSIEDDSQLMYTRKYWENLEKLWKPYARGDVAT